METHLDQFLLKKVRFVTEAALPSGDYSIFGTGGGAQLMRDKLATNPNVRFRTFIEHDITSIYAGFSGQVVPVELAQGHVVIGSKTTHYQFNQILAIRKKAPAVERIYILDDYHANRRLDQEESRPNVVLLGWHSTIEAQSHGCRTLKNYFSSIGCNLLELSALDLASLDAQKNLTHALIWNGQRDFFRPVKDYLSQRGVGTTYLEAGFFPQRDHVYLDRRGVNQECSLMDDDLQWVTPRHLARIPQVKEDFLPGFRRKKAEYILVPLQVPDDANIVYCSRFTSGMQEFIDYVCELYGSKEKLLFKEHPKDPNLGAYDFKGHQVSEAPFTELLAQAKRVHGITSSTLYEAALAGVEVISEGNSLLNKHRDQHDKLLAAMIDRQFHIKEKNLSYWLKRYSNFSLPGKVEGR